MGSECQDCVYLAGVILVCWHFCEENTEDGDEGWETVLVKSVERDVNINTETFMMG